MPPLSRATSRTAFVATSTHWIVPLASLSAIDLPSGDQSGPWRRRVPPLVSCSGSPLPSWFSSQSSSSPVRSEMNAMRAPSGDQRASRSCAPELCVRLRVVPFSIGTLKTSPRATTSARSPLGERLPLSIQSATETCAGRIATPSVGTVISIGVTLPVLVSSTRSSPLSSKTISPDSPLLGQRTSHCFSFVACVTFCVSMS